MPFVQSREFHFLTPLGYQIFGRFFYPPLPTHRTVILCSPPTKDINFFLRSSPINWKKWLFLGCNVVLFDPLGSGRSWGLVDWGGQEEQGSIRSLLHWLETQGEEDVLFVCFGASILSTIRLHTEYPIIAFNPIYAPETLIQIYPELSKKTHHFWKEREGDDAFLRNITILPRTSKSSKEKLFRRIRLLRKTFY